MSEEPVTTEEVKEKPVETSNGSILDVGLDKVDQNPHFLIKKQLEYVVETKEQTRVRAENESTKINKKIWLEAFSREIGSYIEICKKTETPKSTFYSWLKNDSEFRNGVFEIKKSALDVMEDVLVLKAKGGNIQALKIWLENNHPTYSKKIKVETYTGDKTLEDLIDEDEAKVTEHNNQIDELNKEEDKGQSVVHTEHPEDKGQEEEDRPVSA